MPTPDITQRLRSPYGRLTNADRFEAACLIDRLRAQVALQKTKLRSADIFRDEAIALASKQAQRIGELEARAKNDD